MTIDEFAKIFDKEIDDMKIIKSDQYLVDLLAQAKNSIYTIPVIYQGKTITKLNSDLVHQRNISDDNVEKLKRAHICLYRTYEQMSETDDIERLKILAKRCTKIEFIQQELWGYPRDATWHKWFDVPKCKCPKSDNQLRLGTKYYIVDQTCDIHAISKE